MRFLVDECTGPAVASWLRDQGHDVASVYEVARGCSDDEVLRRAESEKRILVTNDKGFGERIVRRGAAHHGLILLRLDDERPCTKIAVLGRLLSQGAIDLEDRIVVVSETSIRISKAHRDLG